MKRTAMFSLIMSAAVLSVPARAADPVKEALGIIPADAMAFVAVPSIANLDSDYQKTIVNLGLQQMVPPPANSLVGMLKMYAPQLAGLDESGALLLVIMPAANVMELQMKQAVVVSTKDPKGMIEGLGGKAGEDEIYSIQFFGTPSHAAVVKDRVVIGMSADVVKAVKASSAGIDSKLSADEVKTFSGLDVILWLDGKRVLAMARPMIDGMLMPMIAAGGAAGEANKKNFEMFLNGVANLGLGVGLENAGLNLRFAMTMQPGSDLAKRSDTKPTAEPLLRGLPASDFMFAFGATMSATAAETSAGDIKELLAMGGKAAEGKLDKEKLAKFEKALVDLLVATAGLRGTVEGLPPSPEGLLGLSILVDTKDSKKWIALTKDAFELGKQMVTDMATAAAKEDDGAEMGEIQSVLATVTYTDGAEKVAGSDVSHIKFDVEKAADTLEIDEDDLEEIKKVLGKDGILFRVAAVDDKQVLLAFGGGEPRAAKFIEGARSSSAALEGTPGIKKVSEFLPKERASVLYVAVDNVIRGLQNIQQVTEEEPIPLQVPPVNAPIAMSSTGGENWSRADVFIHTDLMVAIKNAAMSMMGGGAPPAGDAEPGNDDE